MSASFTPPGIGPKEKARDRKQAPARTVLKEPASNGSEPLRQEEVPVADPAPLLSLLGDPLVEKAYRERRGSVQAVQEGESVRRLRDLQEDLESGFGSGPRVLGKEASRWPGRMPSEFAFSDDIWHVLVETMIPKWAEELVGPLAVPLGDSLEEVVENLCIEGKACDLGDDLVGMPVLFEKLVDSRVESRVVLLQLGEHCPQGLVEAVPRLLELRVEGPRWV